VAGGLYRFTSGDHLAAAAGLAPSNPARSATCNEHQWKRLDRTGDTTMLKIRERPNQD
jgi:hypothetical protein